MKMSVTAIGLVFDEVVGLIDLADIVVIGGYAAEQ